MQGSLVSPAELSRILPKGTPHWFAEGMLRLSGLSELNRLYQRHVREKRPGEEAFAHALRELEVSVRVQDETLSLIPTTGPCLVVANHPFGGIDGLALGAALAARRPDFRIVTNTVLSRIGTLAPWFLEVDVFDANRQTALRAGQLRAALSFLKAGGLVAIFPAGEVSHFQPSQGKVADGVWSSAVGLFAERSRATLVPCFFDGKNSASFQTLGAIHPWLRTLMLPSELLRRRGTEVTMRFGRPVSPEVVRRLGEHRALTAWLRVRVDELAAPTLKSEPAVTPVPVAPAEAPEQLEQEFFALPASQRLVELGGFSVVELTSDQAPTIMREIGRLRELSFRGVGEGSGLARDLDEYDPHYQHLVLFDTTQRKLAGGYRFAFCEQLVRERGTKALYTAKLFRYHSAMRPWFRGTMELGRSFVSPEYQRRPLSLALLWKGIGEVLCRHPELRRLLGPVSISQRFRGTSRNLLLAFLRRHYAEPTLTARVLPRRPVRFGLSEAERTLLLNLGDRLRDLDPVLRELSPGQRTPVLLERYLELGAKVLAVSVDPDFADCIDALMFVDLARAPAQIVKRFMGDEQAA